MGASLGLDPLPSAAAGHDLPALVAAFKGAEQQWQGSIAGEQQ